MRKLFLTLLLLPLFCSAQVARWLGPGSTTSTGTVVMLAPSVTGTVTVTVTNLDDGQVHPYLNAIDVSTLANYIVLADGSRLVTLGEQRSNRALEMETRYSATFAGSSAGLPVAVQFNTKTPAWGTRYAFPLPFNASAWANRDWPVSGYTVATKNRKIVDPITGVPFVTFLAQGEYGFRNADGGDSFAYYAPVSNWTNPANVLAGSLASTGSITASTERLHMFFNPDPASLSANPFNSGAQNLPRYPNENMDNLGLLIWGSGTDASAINRTVRICHWTTVCDSFIDVVLPTGSVAKVNSSLATSVDPDQPFPATLYEGAFTGWTPTATGQFPLRRDLYPHSGTVSVTGGTTLTISSPSTTSHFPVTLQPGNKIRLVGSGLPNELATIATVIDHNSATISETVTNQSYAYQVWPHSITVQKLTATGTINVGLKWRAIGTLAAFSPTSNSTTEMRCHPIPVTEDGKLTTDPTATGKPGELCTFGNLMVFTSFDLSVRRLVSVGMMHTSQFASMAVADRPSGVGSTYSVQPIADQNTPKAWIISATTSGGHRAIYRITCQGGFTSDYNPGYPFRQNNSFAGAWAPPADCFTWQNITPPSTGRAINQQVATMIPADDPSWVNASGATLNFAGASFAGVSGTKAFHFLIGGTNGTVSDNGPCNISVTDTVTGTVERVFSTYVGLYGQSASAPNDNPDDLRWGSCHSVQPQNHFGDGSLMVATGFLGLRISDLYLSGPIRIPVVGIQNTDNTWQTENTALAWPTTHADNSAFKKACPTDIPQWMKDEGATGNTCIYVLIPHDPCVMSTSSSALSIHDPCPSYANAYLGISLKPGDKLFDYRETPKGGATLLSGERFRVLKATPTGTGSQQILALQRNSIWDYGCIDNDPQSARSEFCAAAPSQSAHANGWSLAVDAGTTGSHRGSSMIVRFGTGGQILSAFDNTSWWSAAHSAIGAYPGGYLAKNGTSTPGFTQGKSITVAGPLNWMRDSYAKPDRRKLKAQPVWNGHQLTPGGSGIQIYIGADKYAQSAAPKDFSWHLSASALASGTPGGGIGINVSPTAVAGMTNVWRLTTQHTGSGVNYKTNGVQVWAGPRLIDDRSGPESIDTMPYYSFCHVAVAGWCGTGSVGQTFVKLPRVRNDSACTSGDNFYENPCALYTRAGTGWGRRWVIDQFDVEGQNSQYLSTGLSGIGFASDFWDFIDSATGRLFMAKTGAVSDGIRVQLWIGKMPTYQGVPHARTGYVQQAFRFGPRSGRTHVQILFGYNSALQCTGAEQLCSTNAAATTANPFQFLSEVGPGTPHTCDGASNCTVQVPLVPGMLAYVLRRERVNDVWVDHDIETIVVE